MYLSKDQKRCMEIAEKLYEKFKITNKDGSNLMICDIVDVVYDTDFEFRSKENTNKFSTTFDKTVNLVKYMRKNEIPHTEAVYYADLSDKQKEMFMEVVNGDVTFAGFVERMKLKPESVKSYFRRINCNVSIVLRDRYSVDRDVIKQFW